MNRKIKKDITRKVLQEVIAEYDFKQTVTAPQEEQFGTEQQVPAKGIILQHFNQASKRVKVPRAHYLTVAPLSERRMC